MAQGNNLGHLWGREVSENKNTIRVKLGHPGGEVRILWADLPQNTLSFLSIHLNYPDSFVGHFITFIKYL